jgi:excisionase family DNA binding protein
MSANEKLLYTKREAAQMLSISVRSLDYLIFSRQLPARRIGRRVLIHRDAIEQFARLDHSSIRPETVASGG